MEVIYEDESYRLCYTELDYANRGYHAVAQLINMQGQPVLSWYLQETDPMVYQIEELCRLREEQIDLYNQEVPCFLEGLLNSNNVISVGMACLMKSGFIGHPDLDALVKKVDPSNSPSLHDQTVNNYKQELWVYLMRLLGRDLPVEAPVVSSDCDRLQFSL